MKVFIRVVLILALSLTACAKPKIKTALEKLIHKIEASEQYQANGMDLTSPNGAVVSVGVPLASVKPLPSLDDILFDFDSAVIRPGESAKLVPLMEAFQNNENLKVSLSGNADNRGTIAYNLALGERRALAVKCYLVLLGIPEASITAISYGKERPLCRDDTEDCWSRNRRVEIKIQ